MVDEFSRFARMPKPVMEGEDVADAVRQTVFLMKVGHPEIAIETEIKQDPLRAQFDRRLISQALTNIIKNATEAIEAVPSDELGKGKIDVIASRENDDVLIDVIDNGIGLPKVARQRLLEPYVTTTPPKGTGLGLAIVGRVLEDHGGKTRIEGCVGFSSRPARRLDAVAVRRIRRGGEIRKQRGGYGDARGHTDQRDTNKSTGRRNHRAG